MILLSLSLLAFAACNDNDDMSQDTLSGHGKTPLEVTAVLNVNKNESQTRAENKEFASDPQNDQLVAYFRHVTWGGGTSVREQVNAGPSTTDKAAQLVTFTAKGNTSYTGDDITPIGTGRPLGMNNTNTQQAETLTPSVALYWDDFSNSSDPAYDLRTKDHYLQSYYGYCYNGGTPSEALNETTGVIGWTILVDQTGTGTEAPTNLQKSDLLWSAEQTPVSYSHADNRVDNGRPGIVIPYTHAMSKVTIKVTAGEGFDTDYNFIGTSIVLKSVRTTCTAEAPKAKLTFPTDGTGKGDVNMQPGTGKGTRAFQAIIVPSILTVGNTFATITDMDDNTYNIPVTEAMIKNDVTSGWGSQLTNADEDVNNGTAQARPQTRTDDAQIPGGKGHEMKSGVHYVLNVTLNKTEATVSATILDWDEIEAEGVGEIYFENDIKADKDNDTITRVLRENGFDIYKKKAVAGEEYGTRATTLHWNKTQQVWKYNPVIYWQGGPEYFRALSNVRADAEGTTDKNESLIMENGRDALWGTTLAHSTYEEGAAINPRTGAVPLKFYHAMSKITFNLVDALKDNSDEAARINLVGATIQLTNLATGGTLDLDLGTIKPDAITTGQKTFSEDAGAVPARMGFYAAKENNVKTTYNADVTVRDYIITPQDIDDAAMVIITLADGSVYKAQLNKCTTEVTQNGSSSSQYINKWERGKHYTYTITLGKETITFRALVEGWVPVDGDGKATLEWD